ncbi:hypothetical protein ANN_11672 [Periplaneta americana]|uniref:DUF4817 domain-containing protein n=1 Tax=Periplaneta americana TaxID=6978 RepID=A0ABQ8T773_PERAM|nr:hypothetical protein ANN_11672 [Periplaneta americana]
MEDILQSFPTLQPIAKGKKVQRTDIPSFKEMWTPQEMAQCVTWFIETRSDAQVQRHVQTQNAREPPSRPTIRKWHRKLNLIETGSVLRQKGSGRRNSNAQDIERVQDAFVRRPNDRPRCTAFAVDMLARIDEGDRFPTSTNRSEELRKPLQSLMFRFSSEHNRKSGIGLMCYVQLTVHT